MTQHILVTCPNVVEIHSGRFISVLSTMSVCSSTVKLCLEVDVCQLVVCHEEKRRQNIGLHELRVESNLAHPLLYSKDKTKSPMAIVDSHSPQRKGAALISVPQP